jgi:hypothetical protein
MRIKNTEARVGATRCDCCGKPATVFRGQAAYCPKHSGAPEPSLKSVATDLANQYTK